MWRHIGASRHWVYAWKKKKPSGTKKNTQKKTCGGPKIALGVNKASSRASRFHPMGLRADTHAACRFSGLGLSRKYKSPHGASALPPLIRRSRVLARRVKSLQFFSSPRRQSTSMTVGRWSLTSLSALPQFFFLCLRGVDPSLRLPPPISRRELYKMWKHVAAGPVHPWPIKSEVWFSSWLHNIRSW